MILEDDLLVISISARLSVCVYFYHLDSESSLNDFQNRDDSEIYFLTTSKKYFHLFLIRFQRKKILIPSLVLQISRLDAFD